MADKTKKDQEPILKGLAADFEGSTDNFHHDVSADCLKVSEGVMEDMLRFSPTYTEEEWALIDRACAVTGDTRESFIRGAAKTLAESLDVEMEVELTLSELFEKRLRDHAGEELHIWQGEGDELSYVLVGRAHTLERFDIMRAAISPFVADDKSMQVKLDELLTEHGENYFEGIVFTFAGSETSWSKTDKYHADFVRVIGHREIKK